MARSVITRIWYFIAGSLESQLIGLFTARHFLWGARHCRILNTVEHSTLSEQCDASSSVLHDPNISFIY